MNTDRFLDEFLRQRSVVADYKKAQLWSSPGRFLWIYFIFSVIGLVLNIFLESVLNFNTNHFGVSDLPIFLTVGVGVVSSIVILVASIDKLNSTGLRRKDVVYHHLAESISGFIQQPERNYSKIVTSLNDCVEYVENHEVDYAHPRIEQAIRDYASQLEKYESTESRNKLIDETFETVFGQITESILRDESIEFDFDADAPMPPDEGESSVEFIIRVVSEFFTERRVQLVIPIVILTIALATFPVFGPQMPR